MSEIKTVEQEHPWVWTIYAAAILASVGVCWWVERT